MTGPAILLATPYYPPHTGGVENYVWNLARQLRTRHGRRVVVATTAVPGEGSTRTIDPDGMPIYRLRATIRMSNTPLGLGWVRGLRTIIARERIDLVNGHAPVPLFADAAARASGRTPFVLSYHTGRMRKGRAVADAVCVAYERLVLARTATRARQIVCSSDYVTADQPDLFGGRATTVSPGADLELFRATPVPNAPRIVFAGSLEPATAYKGLTDLIHVIAQLRRQMPAVRLDVLGSGTALGDYQDLASRLGLDGCVRFRGRLEGEDLAVAYRAARVLALPTYYDSFPTVLVEAMASGRPVVTTRVGGVPALVADGVNGLLTQPGDRPAIASALGCVLRSDALAARMGRAGRAHVERELSWARQADRTLEIFDRITG